MFKLLYNIRIVLEYWKAILSYLLFDIKLINSSFFNERIFNFSKLDRLKINIYIYTLAHIVKLWNKKHYRSVTYSHDMENNLKNVYFPNTGISIKYIMFSRFVYVNFILFVYPLICFFTSLYQGNFVNLLLFPNNWFFYWRLNSHLMYWHWFLTNSKSYSIEDKYSFLDLGKKNNIPITPYLKIKNIFIKHRNIEGGMGIYNFKNATVGGDWIIQERLTNGNFIKSLVGEDAPLSTFRVITSSDKKVTKASSGVVVLSCVFRAGRASNLTDHNAIFYNVDIINGKLGKGVINSEWYNKNDNLENLDYHPDTNVKISGKKVPNFNAILNNCVLAHYKLAPDIPLIGWDVALVGRKSNVYILECNLSCNFFMGELDKKKYFKLIEKYYHFLELYQF